MNRYKYGISLQICLFTILSTYVSFTWSHIDPENFGYNSLPVKGERPLLTILLRHSNTSFTPHHTPEYYRKILFAPPVLIDGKLALRSWWSLEREDNFTTSDPHWAGNQGDFHLPGYTFNRIEAYIDPPESGPQPGKKPLYSWWNPKRGDNFLTSNPQWAGKPGDTKSGYHFVRLEGYAESPDFGKGKSQPNIAGIDGFFDQNSNGKFRFINAGILGPFVNPDDPKTDEDESRIECAWDINNTGCNGTKAELKTLANAIRFADEVGFNFARFDQNKDGKITNDELTILVIDAQFPGDNFATTDPKWADKFDGTKGSYKFVRIEGYLDSPNFSQPQGTIPLYHWYSERRDDNLTTSDPQWKPVKENDLRDGGYKFIKKLGYVYPPNVRPTTSKVPLYSWFSPSRGDYFITSNPQWAGKLGDTKSPDYQFVRLEGYIDSPSASKQSGKIPLYSWWSSQEGLGGGIKRGTFPPEISVNNNITLNVSVAVAGEHASIATITHELAHAIGIHWEVYGSNCNNKTYSAMSCTITERPRSIVHLDPWAKIKLGWIKPEIISTEENRLISINATELPARSDNKAYIVYDPSRGKNEFLILEHRFRGGVLNYDGDPWRSGETGIPDNGLGIWQALIDHTTKNLRIIPGLHSFQTPIDKIGLYSWYSEVRKEHFTTGNSQWEWHNANDDILDYKFHRFEGFIDSPAAGQKPGRLPLYSWWNPSRNDNFITSNPKWAGKPGDTNSEGYRFVRIEGYITDPDSKPGINQMPLYSWWSSSRKDNFTTSDPNWNKEIDRQRAGYTRFRLEGYVDKGTTDLDSALFIVPPKGKLGQPNGNGLWNKQSGIAQPNWLDGKPTNLFIKVRSDTVDQPSINVWVGNVLNPY